VLKASIAKAGNAAGALKTKIARSMMDTLAEGAMDALKKSKKTEANKKALAKRRALRNEAKKIAFAHDSQLIGAGNRRISLGTGELVRRTSLYNTIPVNTPAVLVEYHGSIDDDSSDDEDVSVGELGWKTVQRAIRGGQDFTTLEWSDQTNADLRHLLVPAPKPPSEIQTDNGFKVPKQSYKVLMQNHAADRLGMTAANSKFTQKTFKGRFQPVTPGAEPASAKIRMRLPNPLRGLMSPISHRKQPIHPSSMLPLALEPEG
jgi:hypothetical protein